MSTDTAHALFNGTPLPASQRKYLRSGLPGIYMEGPRLYMEGPGIYMEGRGDEEAFAMRFMAALEEILDPIVASIDLLPAHLDLRIAPDWIVIMVGQWLGLDFDRALDADARRRLALDARSIALRRGTPAGIRDVLARAFPNVKGLEVKDSGGVTYAENQAPPPLPEHGPAISITFAAGVPEPTLHAIRRIAEKLTPAGTRIDITGERGATT